MNPFTQLDLRFDDGRNWTLLHNFLYHGPQGSWIVPAGFETDFASIPRIFWRLLPPVGRYGKAALTALGVWPTVADRLAQGEDVRTALAYVARGEAPLGVVYATDARAEPRVRVVALFPENTHPPIVYPAALTSEASPDAAQFLAYLRGPQARAVFERAGFIVLATAP